MRIGIDARELAGRPTGVGRYLAELLIAWDQAHGSRLTAHGPRLAAPAAHAHHFVLFLPAPGGDAAGSSGLPEPVQAIVNRSEMISLHAVPGSGGTTWEQLALANAAAGELLDAFFAPGYTSPLRLSTPTAVTIHDVSFAAHPEWFGAREGLRRRLLSRWSARRARIVLTDSEFSRGQIVDLLGVPAARVRVIRLGIRAPAAKPRDREPLVLFVGSLFNRRRIPDLVAAFGVVARAHPTARLAIVGENRTYPHQDPKALAAKAGVADRVDVHEYVPEATLAELYGRARVFAFLSEYEGFGFTPLEALASGVPVVVLDTPIAREVHGRAAAYVRAGDIDGIAAAIARLLVNEDARAEQLAHAAEVLPLYSWDRAAAETLRALEEIAVAAP